jgi:hexosaminidase
MRAGTLLSVILLGVLLEPAAAPRTTDGTAPARRFLIRWGAQPGGSTDGAFRSRLALVNRGTRTLDARGWTLYFNLSPSVVEDSLPAFVRYTHVNGDFHSLQPGPGFAPLRPGESIDITVATRESIINESKCPGGFYFVFADAPGQYVEPPLVIEPQQSRRAAEDQVPLVTPELRFRQDEAVARLPEGEYGKIVPSPLRFDAADGHVTLDAHTRIVHAPGLAEEARYLAESLRAIMAPPLDIIPGDAGGPGTITLAVAGDTEAGRLGPEGYRLVIAPDTGVRIEGGGTAGVFYGIQSLRALVAPEDYRGGGRAIRLDAARIEDAPRFRYRGLMLDVARSFQSKAAVLKLLELMSFYKLNTLHLHLADDEGWRLAIAALPELTEVGGRRGHTLDEHDRLVPSFGSGPDPERSYGTGYYTRADFVELLRDARRRHIEVVPEADMPGHSRAAIVAMRERARRLAAAGRQAEAEDARLDDPRDRSVYRSMQGWTDNVINVCRPATYRFVHTVVDEVASMYAEAGAPLTTFHVGGDEIPAGAWERSPDCARLLASQVAGVSGVGDLHAHFVATVNDALMQRGLTTGGWEEIALERKIERGRRVSWPSPRFLGRRVRPYIWNNVWGGGGEDNAYKLANAGYDIVMGPAGNLYFDLAYEKDPKEPGQHWAGFVDTRRAYELAPFDLYRSARTDLMGRPIDDVALKNHVRLSESGKAHILGLQGHLWGEYAAGAERMEYLVFPKLLGLAERAWAASPAWEQARDPDTREALLRAAWNEFANRLGQRELPRLCYLAGGVGYRLPLPGAVVEDGLLKASAAFPGLAIRYTTDGSEPTAVSTIYGGPVPAEGTIKLKSFAASDRGSRTSTIVAPPRPGKVAKAR